jgi:sugar O-acyltransferase (sialic acid O-acetyltransferase NeuD family)
MNRKRLAIIGSGDLAKQILHQAEIGERYKPIGFFDDFEEAGKIKYALPVLGTTDNILYSFQHNEFDEMIIGIGYKHIARRRELFNLYSDKIPFGTVIHSSCIIDKSVKIGRGSLLYSGSIVDMNAVVGENVIIYNGCVIAHDSFVGSHSVLSPAVKIAGFSKIGHSSILGIGTVIIDNLAITDNVKTGAGAVVVNNINESGLYIGCPAKKQYNSDFI